MSNSYSKSIQWDTGMASGIKKPTPIINKASLLVYLAQPTLIPDKRPVKQKLTAAVVRSNIHMY